MRTQYRQSNTASEVTELKQKKYWWSEQIAVFTAEAGHTGRERGGKN